MPNTGDSIDLEKLEISFDKDLIYWLDNLGFFKFEFNFTDANKLQNVNCKSLGVLDPSLRQFCSRNCIQ